MEYSIYAISDRLNNVYGFQSSHNKNYQKIKDIAGFYYLTGKKYPKIIGEHSACWILLILPMKKSETKEIRLNSLAYCFYLANMLTFEDKPVINFKKRKIKNFSESDLEEFTELFLENYWKVIKDYCDDNKTTYEDMLNEVTKDVYEKKNNYQFTGLMESMVINCLTMDYQILIDKMHELEDEIAKLTLKLKYIDIGDMADMIKKLNHIKIKLDNLYEDKSYKMKKYLEKEELQPELMLIKNKGRVFKETKQNSESDVVSEVKAFMEKNIKK